MLRRPPGPTRPDTLFPYTPRFRSPRGDAGRADRAEEWRRDGAAAGHRIVEYGQRPGVQPGAARRTVRQRFGWALQPARDQIRSEEHTSELQSLMRISYAVFCLKKKKQEQRI